MWLIQENFYSINSEKALIKALKSNDIKYEYIGLSSLESGRVLYSENNIMVSGAVRMHDFCTRNSIKPGSFMNDNFNVDVWKYNLGSELLNSDSYSCRIADLNLNSSETKFLRPIEDTKSFTGGLFSTEVLDRAKKDSRLCNLVVSVAEPKDIVAEYRVFIVDGKPVTGSMYKSGGRPYSSSVVPDCIFSYATKIAKLWLPNSTCVLDVAETEAGIKIVEFNNFNGCAFYESNVDLLVKKLKELYRL